MSNILVVEADPIFGAVLEDRLYVAGHEVEWLGEAGRIPAAAVELNADVLILEISQGWSDGPAGLDLVSFLRDLPETSHLPILALSPSNERSHRVEALKAGVDDYLAKPCDLEELVLRAERLVDSRVAQGPALQGDLLNHPIWELIQYLRQAKKSGDLILRGKVGGGRVRLDEGEIIAARWEHLYGREALLTVFGLKQGKFRLVADFQEEVGPPEELPVHEILMQAAWLEDELEKLRFSLPPTGAPLHPTDQDLPPFEDDFKFAGLPLLEVLDQIRKHPSTRIFDLMQDLPLAPQVIKLTVAWMMSEKIVSSLSETATFPTTSELNTSMLLELAVTDYLGAALSVGFGTSALPFLILVEPGVWLDLLRLLEGVPGLKRNEELREFIDRLKQERNGSVSLPSDLGKLVLHVAILSREHREEIENVVTVSSGILLWLDEGVEVDALNEVVQRLEEIRTEARGVLVAHRPASRPLAEQLTHGTRRWQVSDHAPQSLLGIFRLLQPRPEDASNSSAS